MSNKHSTIEKRKKNMIIAIDFDGTLHTGAFPAIGSPAPYAVQAMTELADAGHYLIINTCRSGDRLTEAVNWLLEKGIPFHRINDNNPHHVARWNNNCRKIYAHLYVDDRQVGGLPSWMEIVRYVQQMK